MAKPRTYSRRTNEAMRLLGAQVTEARRARRWSVEELAERVGASHPTIRKVERGDPSVGLGVAFEAATVLGVPLFGDDDDRRSVEAARLRDRLTALPDRARRPGKVSNDF